jgi:excisionase family DNA binding protein
MTTSDSYTTAQAAQVLGVTTRRVRQLAAEGTLENFRAEGGALHFPQEAIHEARRRKQGRKSAGRKQAETTIDLRGENLREMVEAIVSATLPRAIEAATSAERSAREAAQTALFEANARASAAETRAAAAEATLSALEAELKTPKRFWGRKKRVENH